VEVYLVKRTVFVGMVLLFIDAAFASAREQYRPIVASIAPQIDILPPPDPNQFQLGRGVMMGVDYMLPSLQPLSTGIIFNYHLRLQHDGKI
jgi:hypothetical protein